MKIIRPITHDEQNLNRKRWIEDLFKLTNRNVSFGQTIDGADQNMDGRMVDVPDTGVANTTFTVIHNLGRVPLFYDIKYRNKACSIYDSGTTWTTTKVFLKCDQANAHVRLFIH